MPILPPQRDGDRLAFLVPVGGGFATELPLPIAEDGSLSPDGTHLAYVLHGQWQRAWKRYRGGQTTPIWIADLKDSSIQRFQLAAVACEAHLRWS